MGHLLFLARSPKALSNATNRIGFRRDDGQDRCRIVEILARSLDEGRLRTVWIYLAGGAYLGFNI